MTHPGNPTPRSPASVLADRSYRFIAADRQQSHVRLIVFHCGTERYFECHYGMFCDTVAATWYEVEPYEVKRIEYRPVPP